VKDKDDWFEMMLSVLLPFLLQQVSASSSIEDARSHATTMSEHIHYALFAHSYFKKYPHAFSQVFQYLESHREACINNQTTINLHNALVLNQMTTNIISERNSHSTSNSSTPRTNNNNNNNNNVSRNASKSNSSNKSPTTTPRTPYAPADGICGKFNSFIIIIIIIIII
jgi:hypothetical protein